MKAALPRPALRGNTVVLATALFLVLAANQRFWSAALPAMPVGAAAQVRIVLGFGLVLTALVLIVLLPLSFGRLRKPWLCLVLVLSSISAFFMHDYGAVVDRSRTSVPIPVQNVLTDLSGFIGGMNPDRLDVIIDELDKALAGGPDRLRNMVSGISRAMAGLTDLLPQTRSLIENLEVVAETTSHAQPDLGTVTSAGSALFQQATAADQEVRRFLDQGPGQLATLGGVVAENADPMTDLTTNFVAITTAAKLRQPAVEALFPSLRQGSQALGVPAHDGAYHTLADFYPRPTCEYDTIPVAPNNEATDTRQRLYNYCLADDPSLQVRGSANAPRPNVGDNGAGPPPGVTGNEMSQPIPGN